MLETGQTHGSYRVEEEIDQADRAGAYRAVDLRTGDRVVLRAAPAAPTATAELREHVRRLAEVDNPHVARIVGVEELDGGVLIVSEDVDGTTLRRRLRENGALEVPEALRIGAEVADALEAIHEAGLRHGRLTPGRILLTHASGAVRVVDPGVDEATGHGAVTQAGHDAVTAHTVEYLEPPAGTEDAGTPYRSPERRARRPFDRRDDVWAFGCILHEALAGEPPATAEAGGPGRGAGPAPEPRLDRLPPTTPAAARRILERCLRADPARRLRDVGDARVELESARRAPPPPAPSGDGGRSRAHPWDLVAVGLLVVVSAWAAWQAWSARPAPEEPLRRLSVLVDPAAPLDRPDLPEPALAISHAGDRIAWASADGERRIWIRDLGAEAARPLAGTEGGGMPFFSPDGGELGFFAHGKLKLVSLAGGEPVTLADAPAGRGGLWTDRGEILFAPDFGTGLYRVPATGGTAVPVTEPDAASGELGHELPAPLPEPDRVLFTVHRSIHRHRVAVADLASGTHRTIFDTGANARYASPGYLLYGQGDRLLTVAVDGEYRAVGAPRAVEAGVLADASAALPLFALSPGGTLVFAPHGAAMYQRRLVWTSRDGTPTPALESPGGYTAPRLDPGGDRVALTLVSESGSPVVHVLDLRRGALSQLGSSGTDLSPVWVDGGAALVFASDADGLPRLYRAGGFGAPAIPLEGLEPGSRATSWAAPGDLLAITVPTAEGRRVRVLSPTPADAGEPAEAILEVPGSDGALSPDGRWLALVDASGGRPEVHVRPVAGDGATTQVSSGGGVAPRWRPDGRELYYRSPSGLMVVEVAGGDRFSAGVPELLFGDSFAPGYDVAPGGRRFLMLQEAPEVHRPTELVVVLGWRRSLDEG